MQNYIAFPAFAEFAPLDISFLFEDEKPAGKHGFLKAEGDRFVFEDGTAVRFWGTNLNGGACFPEKEYAPKLAKRIASFGCNMVRLHQLDSEANIPNIYMCRRGIRLKDTQHFDEESLDRLDYMIACMKKEGIYIYLDMTVSRVFRSGDGVANWDLPKRSTPYCIIDARMIRLQKQFMDDIWNHVNPYTGLAYKDEPAIALSDVVNEQDLFGVYGKIELEPYATDFRNAFRAWCGEKGIRLDVDAVDLNYNSQEHLVEYKTQRTAAYYNEMMDYMRQLGVKIPMAGNNHSQTYLQTRAANIAGDFMDTHLNIRFMKWGPGGRYWQDISLHELPEWGSMRSARRRRFGKPMFHSEWDLTWPNRYRAESSIMLAAVGGLQNWSGATIHTYAYTSLLQHMDILGKEVSCATIEDTGYREGPFATWNDPAKFGMFYHAALITRRGDVRPSENKILIGIDGLEKDGVPNSMFHNMKKKAFPAATELCQIGVTYNPKEPGAVSDLEPIVDLSKGEVASDTGELYRSWKKRYGTVDTPMTKSVYGRLGRIGNVVLNGMRINCKNDYATIALSSLNNALPIDQTDSMLLTTVGVVENTDMKMSMAPANVQKWDGFAPFLQMDDFGKAPIVCEVIEAEVSIRTNRTNMVVWAVNAEGIFVGNVPTKYEDGYLKFTLGKKSPSIYYLIQAE